MVCYPTRPADRVTWRSVIATRLVAVVIPRLVGFDRWSNWLDCFGHNYRRLGLVCLRFLRGCRGCRRLAGRGGRWRSLVRAQRIEHGGLHRSIWPAHGRGVCTRACLHNRRGRGRCHLERWRLRLRLLGVRRRDRDHCGLRRRGSCRRCRQVLSRRCMCRLHRSGLHRRRFDGRRRSGSLLVGLRGLGSGRRSRTCRRRRRRLLRAACRRIAAHRRCDSRCRSHGSRDRCRPGRGSHCSCRSGYPWCGSGNRCRGSGCLLSDRCGALFRSLRCRTSGAGHRRRCGSWRGFGSCVRSRDGRSRALAGGVSVGNGCC